MTRSGAASRILLLASLSSLAAGALAQPSLQITSLDGVPVSGKLIRVTPEIAVLSDSGERSFAWDEVLEVRPTDAPAAAPSPRTDPLCVELADGSLLRARITAASADQVTLRVRDNLECAVALNAIRVITSTTPPEFARAALERFSAEAGSEQDALLAIGEGKVHLLDGSLRAVGVERVTFRWKGQDRQARWENVVAVRQVRAATRSADQFLRLRDGDVLGGRVIGASADGVLLRSSILGEVAAPWSAIERIECRSDRMVYLSDLKAIQYDFDALFTQRWEPAMDRGLDGGPIVLAGRRFQKGVSMRSRSSLAYRIDGAAAQFVATVGVLDETNGRGDCVAAIVGDGRVRWTRRIRGGEAPAEASVDVRGVQLLELIVEWGADLDISDHVGWGNARLIR